MGPETIYLCGVDEEGEIEMYKSLKVSELDLDLEFCACNFIFIVFSFVGIVKD